MRLRFILLLTILLISRTSSAQKNEAKPDDAQIKSWIEGLANAGSKRAFSDPDDRLTPQELENLKPVRAAYKNLTKHFTIALPLLIKNRNDVRYSYPQEHPSSGVFENQTVGAACRSIIQRKVLLQNPMVIDSRFIAVWHTLPIDRAWYEKSKGQSLYEIQRDALDWLLKQPPPEQVDPSLWKDELAEVRKYRDEFVKGGTAIDETFGPAIQGR